VEAIPLLLNEIHRPLPSIHLRGRAHPYGLYPGGEYALAGLMITMVWISSTTSKESAVSSFTICAKVKRRRVKPKRYDRIKNASIWPCCSLLVKLHQADVAYAIRITIIDWNTVSRCWLERPWCHSCFNKYSRWLQVFMIFVMWMGGISTQTFYSLKNFYIKFNYNCTKMLTIVICCVLAIHVEVQRTTINMLSSGLEVYAKPLKR